MEMNNEPVACTPPENVWTSCVACGQRVTGDSIHTCSPQLKTLTDEEIQELALCDEFWISEDCTIFDWHKFAKAILRKAQEK
jgi:hypothetical protein